MFTIDSIFSNHESSRVALNIPNTRVRWFPLVATDYLWLGATLVMVIMVASIFLYLPTSPVVLTEIPHEIHVFFFSGRSRRKGDGASILESKSGDVGVQRIDALVDLATERRCTAGAGDR